MNLHDVVPLTKKPSTKESTFIKSIDVARETTEGALAAVLGVLKNTKPGSNDRSAVRTTISLICENHNSSMMSNILNHFKKTQHLPSFDPMKLSFDDYYNKITSAKISAGAITMSDSPRTDVSHLMELSRKAGMIAIPIQYLNPSSYSSESWTIRTAIAKFIKSSTELDMNIYVICPIRHYSLIHHLKSKNPNLPIIANDNQIHFDTMSMMLPALLMMEDRISGLEGDTKTLMAKYESLDATTKNILRGMESMEKRLDQLSKTVESDRLRLIESQNTAVAIEQAATAARSSDHWFMPYDPLMFAFYGDLEDTTTAFVGPCWGPDLPGLVVAAAGLTAIPGQRKKIETKIY